MIGALSVLAPFHFYHMVCPSDSETILQSYHILCLFVYIFISYSRLLITFERGLDPDQARQNVGPDLNTICLTLKPRLYAQFAPPYVAFIYQ